MQILDLSTLSNVSFFSPRNKSHIHFLLCFNCLYFRIPPGTSPELSDLLMGLLRRNARDRMPFDEFFGHPFLQGSRESPSPVPAELPASPGTLAIQVGATAVTRLEPETTSPCSSPEDDFVLVPSDLSSDTDNNTNTQIKYVVYNIIYIKEFYLLCL